MGAGLTREKENAGWWVVTSTDVLFMTIPEDADMWPALCLGSWLCGEVFSLESSLSFLRKDEAIWYTEFKYIY